MRVSQNSTFDSVRDSVAKTKGRMEQLQTQSGTMRKINRPSDDPVGSTKILDVRTEKVNNDQYQSNAKLAETMMQLSDQAMSELGELVMRAKEIALGQASGASATGETRRAVAEEVKQLYEQAIAIGNRRIGDRFLFSGFKTNTPPISGSGEYQGDLGQIMSEIGKGVFLASNITGAEAFNSNYAGSSDLQRVRERQMEKAGVSRSLSSGSGQPANGLDENSQLDPIENVNVFSELQALRIGLMTGDMEGIRATLGRLDEIQGHIVSTRAKIGSRVQGLNATTQSLERQGLTHAKLTSEIEDADMAQVVSDLAKEEIVFRSALATSQKLIQPTLMDFLK